MHAKTFAVFRDDDGTDWPIPTANIANLKRITRHQAKTQGEGAQFVHLSDPQQIKYIPPTETEDEEQDDDVFHKDPRQNICLLYTSPSPRD